MKISNIFKKTDASIGRASDWIGVATFAGAILGALSWPTSAIEFISRYGWGAIFISALIFACLLLLSMASMLISYRKFRPLKIDDVKLPTSSIVNTSPSDTMMEIGKLREQVELLNREVVRLKKDATASHEEAENMFSYHEKMIGGAQEQLKTFKDNVRRSFAAQRTRNIYENLHLEIDQLIEELSDPTSKHDIFPTWQYWSSRWDSLKSRLNYMTRVVEEYIDVREAMFNVPHEKFKSQYWSFDDHGMSEDQKHDYKTFRIISSNYRDLNSKISSALIDAVYKYP